MNPLRLNLGCGLQAPDGWVNIDRSPSLMLDRMQVIKKALRAAGVLQLEHMVAWPRNIEMVNVLKPFPYQEGKVEAIYSSHMLEHLYYEQALSVLRECHRVIQLGGVLRLALPDGAEFARSLTASPPDDAEAGLKFSQSLNMQPLRAPSKRQRLVSRFASAPHRWQPTAALVIRMVRDCGFTDVRECSFRDGKLPDLTSVEHRDESLFVEARR
jgi:hypothetical protein